MFVPHLEGLLVGVYEHVGLEVPLRDGGVGAEVALEALLPLVGLLVHLEGVSVREGLAAHLAVHGPVRGVQLLDVKAEVGLAPAGGRAELALEHGLVPRVYLKCRSQFY